MSAAETLKRRAQALRLKKSLSQHFLVDSDALTRIAQAAAFPEDKTMPIVEIGPGAGFLTEALCRTGHPVTAIEVDSDLVPLLADTFQEEPGFRLIHGDVLKQDLVPLLVPKGIVVGNLPYHLTGPILFQMLGELDVPDHPVRRHLHHAVVMVQQEVADRLLASPGDKAYGQLTIQLQMWATITPVMRLAKEAFYPPPQVGSAVIQLTPRHEPRVVVSDAAALGRLVKSAFRHRRKTLANNLKLVGISSERIRTAFDACELSETIRPQAVSVQHYACLLEHLSNG